MALDATAPRGLCPRCLVLTGIESVSATASGPVSTELLPGQANKAEPQLGSYDLLEEIGHGGMGVVHRARHRTLHRTVALKRLLLGRWTHPRFVERFRAEARAAAALRHPAIVAIHEVGEDDGQPWFAMDYVPGPNLAEVLRDRPLPAREAATIVRQIAEGLQHAHSHGILHRDLKPANILLDAEGRPRVADFGLAKDVSADLELTQSGHVLGSPHYMPPEQVSGRHKLGVGADVYSLGAILYHALTGRPPFQAETLERTLLQVLETDPARPQLVNPSVPRDLETVCLKCLEKEPAKRYATAQELADELERFLKDEPILVRPVTRIECVWRWGRRKPALAGALAAAALFLVVGLAGVLWQWRSAQRIAAVARLAATQAEASALDARRAQYASDMNLAHRAVQEGDFFRARQLLERHRPLLGAPPLAGLPSDHLSGGLQTSTNSISAHLFPSPLARISSPSPQLSTDLRGWEWRYLWRESQGDPHRVLAQLDRPVTSLGVLPDGQTAFASSFDKTVRFWNLDSGRETGVLPHPEKVLFSACSPEGRWMVTGTTSVNSNNDPVRLWDLTTKAEVTILTSNLWLRQTMVFSPDGQWLALDGQSSGIHLWSLSSRQPLTNLASSRGTLGPVGIAFSPDNRLLAYGEHNSGDIVLWDTVARTAVGRLTGHALEVYYMVFSLDGRTLFTAGRDRLIKAWDVLKQRERFSFSGHRRTISGLALSADGHTLATASWDQQVRLIDANFGLLTAELRGHRKPVTSVAFTPDGRRLISGGEDGAVRMWEVPPALRELDAQSIPPGVSWAWNTYGPALALASDGSALALVFTNRTFSLRPTDSFEGGGSYSLPFTNTTAIEVAPGGQACAFGSEDGRVALWDANNRQFHTFAHPETNELNRLAYSADGKLLAMSSDRFLRVWNVSEQRELHVFPKNGSAGVMSLAFSGTGRHLLAGFFNGTVRVWNLAEKGPERILEGHEWQVRGLLMLPDERTLISTATEIKVWDVSTGLERLQLTPRVTGFFAPVLSPDHRRLAVGAVDGLITLWDVASWDEVATLSGQPQDCRHLAFSKDGSTLISAGPHQLRLFHAAPSD